MNSMNREETLRAIFENVDDGVKNVVVNLISEAVYLENRLDELKKLPFIAVNPNNPNQQKTTPAARLYKDLLQQYNAVIKTIVSALVKNEVEEESPLREYLKSLKREA